MPAHTLAKEATQMFINTNVQAINAQRNLGVTNAKMGRALERLSSGLRINRAADDAAGLSISEGLRSQVRGLQQGTRNAQDGISMIQTAEGALNEVHGILQRMRELSVQSGNSTLSAADRTAVGEELLTLKTEIDNIASRTKFNGLNLLTGDLSVSLSGGTLNGVAIVGASTGVVTAAVDVSGGAASTTYTAAGSGSNVTLTNGTTGVAQTIAASAMATANAAQTLNFSALGVKVTLTHDATTNNVTAAEIATGLNTKTIITAASSGNATYQVGANAADTITVAFANMQSAALGNGGVNDIGDLVTDNTSVSTVAKSNTLLGVLDTAISQVSSQRSKLGAAQNQVEAAVNSLSVAVENLSASESRIRDADIAAVSSELVTRQIMQQAGVAVLSQANSASQSVLSLLRG